MRFPEEHPQDVLAAMQMDALTRPEVAERLGVQKGHQARYKRMCDTLELMERAGWIAGDHGEATPRYLACTMMRINLPPRLVDALDRIADALAPKHTF